MQSKYLSLAGSVFLIFKLSFFFKYLENPKNWGLTLQLCLEGIESATHPL